MFVPRTVTAEVFPPEPDQCIAFEADQCRDDAMETAIEFIRLCPDPYFFNTGPHRALMGIRYEGERYAMAFEEAEGVFKENLFIGAYSEEGRRRVEESYQYAVDIVAAAVRSVAGVELFRPVHDFNVCLYDNPSDILAEGCTESPSLFEF